MPKPFMSVRVYAGRSPHIVNVNLSLDREAAELLATLAPTKKARGAFLSRLLHEHRARHEGRDEARAELQQLLEANVPHA